MSTKKRGKLPIPLKHKDAVAKKIAHWADEVRPAFGAYRAVFSSEDEEDALTDLITGLLHLANLKGHDVAMILERVEMHYKAEQKGEF